MAPVVLSLNVIGRSMAMAPTGPMPGNTPTSVPRTEPTKQKKRFSGVRAMEKPYKRLCSVSIKLLYCSGVSSPPERSPGKLNLQGRVKQEIACRYRENGAHHRYPEPCSAQDKEHHEKSEY